VTDTGNGTYTATLIAGSASGSTQVTAPIQYSADALTYWGERYFKTGQMPPSAPRMKRGSSLRFIRP